MKRCGSHDRHNLSSGSFFQCDDAWIDTHTSTCRFKLSYIFIQTLIFSSFDNLCYFVLILFCSRFPSWCFDTRFSFAFLHRVFLFFGRRFCFRMFRLLTHTHRPCGVTNESLRSVENL